MLSYLEVPPYGRLRRGNGILNIGCGVDIIEIEKVKKAVDSGGERFCKKIFTYSEIKYCENRKNSRYRHYAVRFAAKEAVAKVLGTGFSNGVRWTDIEVVCDERGNPSIILHGSARDLAESMGIKQISISLSHCDCHAVAVAVSMDMSRDASL